jgi:hypothetical protein
LHRPIPPTLHLDPAKKIKETSANPVGLRADLGITQMGGKKHEPKPNTWGEKSPTNCPKAALNKHLLAHKYVGTFLRQRSPEVTAQTT